MKTGVDIIKTNRIKKILKEKKESFYSRIFTEDEIKYIENKNHDYRTVAGLFASKEAVSKVIGTGIGKLRWKDIEIIHDNNGKPFINFSQNLRSHLNQLGINSIEISISHEEEYAISFAVGYYFSYKDINIPKEIKTLLPKRKEDSHKGDYGRVGIIGGSRGMTGAPYLTTMAALRSGTGLVYTLIPKTLEDIMAIKLTEAIIVGVDDNKGDFSKNSISELLDFIKKLDGLAIGPGFGVSDDRLEIIEKIFESFQGPIVLDADGINCIAKKPDILLKRKGITVMTPHPGELANFLGNTVKEVQDNRIYYSKYVSQKYNIITILKGNNTIVAKGEQIFINSTGNPGMATGGSGDILTGMVISFICQGNSPFDSSVLGVFSHGLAGDMARDDKGDYGLIAMDILEYIPKALKKILE